MNYTEPTIADFVYFDLYGSIIAKDQCSRISNLRKRHNGLIGKCYGQERLYHRTWVDYKHIQLIPHSSYRGPVSINKC